MDNAADNLKDAAWRVRWASEKSQRYHARRTAFFSRWNRVTAFAGICAASAVFASLTDAAPAWLASAGALFVLVMSGVDLVIGSAEMARKHDDLRRRFCELEADIHRAPEPTAEQVAAWSVRRLAIEADEPPTHVALDLLCDNELRRAHDYRGTQGPRSVHWLKALTAQFFRWYNTAPGRPLLPESNGPST